MDGGGAMSMERSRRDRFTNVAPSAGEFTVAVLVAGSVALMNLYRVARPLNPLRAALVISMISLFAVAFMLPWSRDLFELPLTAAWAYGAAAALIAVSWPLLELGSRFAQRWHHRDS